jgi:hypothetical protein
VISPAGCLHQLGRASDESVEASARHQGDHLSLLGDRPGESHLPGLLVDRLGLTRQRRLIHAEVLTVDELGVGEDDVAQADADDVARNQDRCGNLLSASVPEGASPHGELSLASGALAASVVDASIRLSERLSSALEGQGAPC